MIDHVEKPIIEKFRGNTDKLMYAAKSIGGSDITDKIDSADLAVFFQVFPKVPLMLLFWDEDKHDGFEAEVRFLFDETITEHLDIESILFLSERLKQLLCEDN